MNKIIVLAILAFVLQACVINRPSESRKFHYCSPLGASATDPECAPVQTGLPAVDATAVASNQPPPQAVQQPTAVAQVPPQSTAVPTAPAFLTGKAPTQPVARPVPLQNPFPDLLGSQPGAVQFPWVPQQVSPVQLPVEVLNEFVVFARGIEAYDQYAVKLTNRSRSFVCLTVPTDSEGVPFFRKRIGRRHVQTWITPRDLPTLPCPMAIPPNGVVNLAVEGGYVNGLQLTYKFYSYTPNPRFEREAVGYFTFPYVYPTVDDACTENFHTCTYNVDIK